MLVRRTSWAAAMLGMLPALAATRPGIIQVTGIRSWSHADSTRVIIETSGPFDYRSDPVHQPGRLFLDIPHSRPWIAHRRTAGREIGDRLVKRVLIGEKAPGITRITFELAPQADYKITKLDAPDRLVVELRAPRNPLLQMARLQPAPYVAPTYEAPANTYIYSGRGGRFVYPPLKPAAPLPRPFFVASSPAPVSDLAALPESYLPDTILAVKPPKKAARVVARVSPPSRPTLVKTNPLPSENASRSLTRALGLKVNRVVIDAGHGGHDDGTIGPSGLMEKDVVLDVALRLARLVESKLGAEVVLTRSDDTFIPLQERTAIANQRKADLFLSIHANSSPTPEAAGTETFYLNFANSPGALEVAARENAGSDKTVGELKGLIQSITLNEKIEESRTFAQTIENTLQAQAMRSNSAARDRGVKRAPFVVLIGASMPSVLAEIGFLSNPRDESNLATPEYRQKVAEALFKGVSQYSQSLSHFESSRQLAETADKVIGSN